MNSSKKPIAILSGVGSRGDVNPMLAIAKALRERGFDAVLSVGEPYAALVEAAGVQSESLLSKEAFEMFLETPGLWTEWGSSLLMRDVVPRCLRSHWEVIERHYRPGRTVLVAHPLDFASRVFRDLHPETPLASIHLAPASLRTPADPPKLTSRSWELRKPEWFVRGLYWCIDHTLLASMVQRPLNQFRRELGLAKVSRPLCDWWYSPDCVLAMFPDWFAPHVDSRLARIDCLGFPLDDGPANAAQQHRLEALQQQLQRLDQRPLVFTAGSANRQARAFFTMVAKVLTELQLPAVLLSPQPEQIASDLPREIIASGYVPLHTLLPLATGIVHHGGVGTTGAAMAAGCPQLIIPRAFDQFDNARRVVQLGCGVQLLDRKLTASRLRAVLLDRFAASHRGASVDATGNLHGSPLQAAAMGLANRVQVGAADRAADRIATLLPG